MKDRRVNSLGVTLLPLVIMIGLVIVELGLAMAFVVYLSNLSSYGTRLAQEALFGARSGIDDAILRIIRNKDFSSTTGLPCTTGYPLTVGRVNVCVVVIQWPATYQDCTPATNQDCITSTGTILTGTVLRQKRYQAIVSVDPETLVVSLVSLTEK
jgi:hypothetical protein